MRTFRAVRAASRTIALPQAQRQAAVSSLRTQFRPFHATAVLERTESHVLSDIGEGVKEVQVIQWFVEEGAAVEEWAPLCEVQSDKASVEITSKYSGVIKKLHYERDAVVQVGDVLLDIEVEGEEDGESEQPEEAETTNQIQTESDQSRQPDVAAEESPQAPPVEPSAPPKQQGKHATLATPAVRGMLKQHNLDIQSIQGSGKDGRVMKEDVQRHIEQQKQPKQSVPSQGASTPPALSAKQQEMPQNMTAIQSAMFKAMTKSLSIPHFLYSDTINVTALGSMRSLLNERRNPLTPKLSYMPFVIKAVSLALNQYPLLNARIDQSDTSKPKLQMRSSHNIGVAMDTPAGLLVPVIKNVNARSIVSIAEELARLAELGAAGKLSGEDLAGGTITVSNIGSIGGGVVAPVIVEGQLAIMGMGKIKATPVFASDGKTIERADMLSANWSADHRVVDGATMARMAALIQTYLEHPESMLVQMS